MTLWWIKRESGRITAARPLSPNDDMTEGPLDDTTDAELIAFLNPVSPYLPMFTLLGRLTIAEYTAIRQAAAAQLAAGSGQLEQWLDMARTAPNGVNLTDAVTIAAKASIVGAGLLTQARADAVFAAG